MNASIPAGIAVTEGDPAIVVVSFCLYPIHL